MISFIKWLEQVTGAAATTSASVAGSPGATTSTDIAVYTRPIGTNIARRQYLSNKKHRRKKRHRK